jgi:hypothetical protein
VGGQNLGKWFVVTTAYLIPHSRIENWLRWNSWLWEYGHATPVIVGHPPVLGEMPEHDCILPYPEVLEPFCLAKTSNAGIRYAIEQGAEMVVKTDIDCIITVNAWTDWHLSVKEGKALAPKYMMTQTDSTKDIARAEQNHQLVGTIVATSGDWIRSKGYDERMVGYGIEDGDLRDRMIGLGIQVPRGKAPIYHVAHRAGTPQVPGKRRDQWNRHGVNPMNREENMGLRGTWGDVAPPLVELRV